MQQMKISQNVDLLIDMVFSIGLYKKMCTNASNVCKLYSWDDQIRNY
jgi:hypothetical protein